MILTSVQSFRGGCAIMRGAMLPGLLIGFLALLVAAGLLFGFSVVRAPGAELVGPITIDPLPVLVGLAVVFVGVLLWCDRARRRALGEVARALETVRLDPEQNPRLTHLQNQGPAVQAVLPALEALVQQHQKLTAELAAAHDQIEAYVRDNLANSDSSIGEAGLFNQPPPGSRYVISSKRQRMVARLTPSLQWLGATPQLLRFLGCTGRDLVARSFLEFVNPEDVPALQTVLEEAIQDGEGHNIVFQVNAHGSETPDIPELRHVQMDVMTCYSDKGVPQHLRCHLLDITEKVRTERELRRRTEELQQANARLRQINHDLQRLKESYRDLYHNAPVLYFSLDIDGNFAAINDSLLRTLGHSREELMGQPYTVLLTEEDRRSFLTNPALFQQPGEIEARWVKRDGTVIDVWIGTTTIKDARGNFVRSRSAARDMTERNRLARALQNKAEEVLQANARLRTINQELEDFTYVVSHDLKEPLRTLEAFSNFLAQDYGVVLQGDGQEYINHLIQASKRLARLIDDLLTLSRVGRFMKKPGRFSWDTILHTVKSDLHELIQRKKGTLHIDGPLPGALGDPERIGQLLTNLISNGLKYNTSEAPEVHIGVRLDSPPGQVAIYIKDNGIGIAPQYHEQIFRMFRRLHHREEFEGTGAGLAICKKIVEGHGGRIWVESAPGQGATFFFTLPADAREDHKTPINGVPVIETHPEVVS
jgi:PAS domain S-box-containing protein